MPWKQITVRQFARSVGANIQEVREKQRLIERLVKARKTGNLSLAALAKKVGVTQARIAQIESGIGTATVSFDVLLKILVILGFEYRVVMKKAA
jgi:transcriptional regulator with XRE-family HTH domain